MGANINEDFADYLGTGDFGDEATFTSPAIGAVNGIFDEEYTEVSIGEAGIESREPMFTCATASLDGVEEGSTLTINSTAYAVKDRQDDGTGLTVLTLYAN